MSLDVVISSQALSRKVPIEKLQENSSIMMLTIFLLFSFSISTLTFLALKNKGPNQAEIKITLNFMWANFKAITRNIKTLLLLLIKDLFQNNSKTSLINLQPNIDADEEDPSEEESFNTIEEDYAISEFSPELIQSIEEEENKAA